MPYRVYRVPFNFAHSRCYFDQNNTRPPVIHRLLSHSPEPFSPALR